MYEYYTRFKNFIDLRYKETGEVKEKTRKKKIDEVMLAYEKIVRENNKRKNFEQGIKRSNFSTNVLDTEKLQTEGRSWISRSLRGMMRKSDCYMNAA